VIVGDLVGIPYVLHGDDFDGCDCIGLVKLFHREILKIDFPDFTGFYKNPRDFQALDRLIEDKKSLFKQVTEPVFGDIIVYRLGAFSCHTGIFLNDAEFIHAHEGHFSAIERIDSIGWRSRIIGYFRVCGIQR
jgi:cell wall-associated NlpC family hydrolase